MVKILAGVSLIGALVTGYYAQTQGFPNSPITWVYGILLAIFAGSLMWASLRRSNPAP
jgi:hypothetical protein